MLPEPISRRAETANLGFETPHELEHAAKREIPERQEQEQLLRISGTGARLYGPRTHPEPKPS